MFLNRAQSVNSSHIILYFPGFSRRTHQNKDVVQFPLHLARHLGEDLTVCSSAVDTEVDGYEVAQADGLFAFIRIARMRSQRRFVMYFLSPKSKARAIAVKCLCPTAQIVVKADQDEKRFDIKEHLVPRRPIDWVKPLRVLNALFFKSVSVICVETRGVHSALSVDLGLGEKIAHVPNGSAVIPEIKEKMNTILFVGRYESEQKNFELFHQTVRRYLSDFEGWQVEVIGGEKKSSGTKGLRFLGSMSHSETMAKLASAKILALSSLHEGSPIVFAEAKASGCAILTTEVSSARDAVTVPTEGEVSRIDDADYARAFQDLVARCARDGVDFHDIQKRYRETLHWDKTTAPVAELLKN